MTYNIRKDNNDVLQPFGIMYTKPPIVSAAPNFTGYHIQLPRLAEMEPDFKDEFFCWFYTMYTAHNEGKTVQEVLEMSPQLQEYAKQDKGYRQYCEQYEFAVADPQTRDEYYLWYKGQMHEEGIIMAALDDERERVEKEMFEDKRKSILKMTKAGMDDATIADMLNLSLVDVGKYR